MKVTNDIYYIGVNDHSIDLFEGQYAVPNGMSYNSYVIIDEKIAVLDTVDAKFSEQWLENLKNVLDGKKPDYLIVHHMEPDHSANIRNFTATYPDAKIVGNAKTFAMISGFFDGIDIEDRKVVVNSGGTLSLGRHNLTFIFAPMVHWPEVMVTYDAEDKALFTADGFGKFGALDVDEDWSDEARRYYIGIVGKYGPQVQALLKKTADLDISIICPLHGPVLTENLSYYINLYDTWSSYKVESDGILIAYASVYGNTRKAAELLAEKLRNNGMKNVFLHDLARGDMAEAVAKAFQYGKVVLAAITYNAEIFPFMREYIHQLAERNFQGRTVGLIENGSWAPMAAKVMKNMLEGCKNITFTDTTVSIKSGLNAASIAQIDALADELSRA